MRGAAERQATLTPDGIVPKDHPLCRIKPLDDSALRRTSPLLDQLYAADGRTSIPPKHLLKSSLLMAFYTVRLKRQFCDGWATTSCSSGSWASIACPAPDAGSRTGRSIRPRSRRTASGSWRPM